jgi:hypothetical protein
MLSQMRWTAVVALSFSLSASCGPGPEAMPHLEVKITGASIPVGVGGYCWPSGGNTTTCADPLSFEKVIQVDHLTPSRVPAASAGQISFDRRPNSIDLMAGLDESHLQAVPSHKRRLPDSGVARPMVIQLVWTMG